MTQPRTEQRAADRFAMPLPITMEGEEGAVHDLSAGGILLESSQPSAMGTRVTLSLHYRRRGVDHELECQGRVVRVEQLGDGYNIAVQLDEPLFADSSSAARLG